MNRPIYNQNPFDPPKTGSDPATLFADWFSAAKQAEAENAAVAALATAGADARLSLRMVLLKHCGPGGFVFYTNYKSRKAADLAVNPFAAMTFWWPAQERQVRIEGSVQKVSSAESDVYFASRPRESQISAWASPQSRVIGQPVSTESLREHFGSGEIPRPADWGGYRLVPEVFEFWQGRASRLHDRIRFTKAGDGWQMDRLAP